MKPYLQGVIIITASVGFGLYCYNQIYWNCINGLIRGRVQDKDGAISLIGNILMVCLTLIILIPVFFGLRRFLVRIFISLSLVFIAAYLLAALLARLDAAIPFLFGSLHG